LRPRHTATGEAHGSGAGADAVAFERARRRLGLSYRQLGAKVGASHVAAFRWCQGIRPAPASLYAALGIPMLTQERQLAAEQRQRPRITVRLPAGIPQAEAFAACARAVAEALNHRCGEDAA